MTEGQKKAGDTFDTAVRELPGGRAVNFIHEGRNMSLLFSELGLKEDASDQELLLAVGVLLLKPAVFMQNYKVERSDGGVVVLVPVKKGPDDGTGDQVFPGSPDGGP